AEYRADPEAAGEVGEFGIGRVRLAGRHDRLERHAADRAIARPVALDLGMHGTGPGGARRRRRRRVLPAVEVIFRIGLELVLAAGAAEVVALAFMLAHEAGAGTIDLHAADRIDGG